MNLSLNARLLLASGAVLAAFLGATGLVLDNAFRDSAETTLHDRLQGHIYALLAASDTDANGRLHLPADLPDPRFSQLGSGLYATVSDDRGGAIWRSRSMLGMRVPFASAPALGRHTFARLESDTGIPFLSLAYTVSWEAGAGKENRYTYFVAENLAGFNEQLRRYRSSLWGWLAAAAALLLLVQSFVLHWSLAPLRGVAHDLHAIEAGLAHRLRGRYPRELRQLTDNLNGLLDSADTRLQRYRDSLGNLAHSLKTPLAVLRNAIDGERDVAALKTLARGQLDAMTRLIEFQLQRAASAGRAPLAAPVAVKPLIEEILPALHKVYAGKRIETRLDLDPAATFVGDRGDLMEVLGNLLDNAFKWCRNRVQVSIHAVEQPRLLIEICIDDDGPGIPIEQRATVLRRGARADADVPGHGLGLAMVQDTVRLYQGDFRLEESGALGGLRVVLQLPVIHA